MTCRWSRSEYGKTRMGGPESGICAPIRIPALPGAPIARDPASREAGRARDAPPGHSAGPAECGAVRTVTQGGRRRSPHPVAGHAASTTGCLNSLRRRRCRIPPRTSRRSPPADQAPMTLRFSRQLTSTWRTTRTASSPQPRLNSPMMSRTTTSPVRGRPVRLRRHAVRQIHPRPRPRLQPVRAAEKLAA